MASIPVGILGATGMVGQQFIALLANHPWFKVEWLGASQRSAGKAFRDAAAWRLPTPLPDDVAQPHRRRRDARAARRSWCSPGSIRRSPARSKAPSPQAGHVIVSNSRNYRMDADVPLLIPEVNADHLALLDAQARRARLEGPHRHQPELLDRRARDGARAAPAVRPEDDDRHDAAGDLRRRLSGRRRRGTSSATSSRTSAAAKKRRSKPRRKKILGSLGERRASSRIRSTSARTTTRVPVQNGHTGSISVGARAAADAEAIIDALDVVQRAAAGARAAVGAAAADRLPAPRRTGRSRALDVDRDGGMTVTVGRLRPCPVLDYKFVALGHNTIRGAAGAAILNAELMHREGLL